MDDAVTARNDAEDKAKEAAKEKQAKPADKTAGPTAKDPCDQLLPKDGSAKK